MHKNLPLNSSKNQILFILQHKFYALDYLEPDQLSYFKCLNWSAEFTLSLLNNNHGIIWRDNLPFIPIWQGCTPATHSDQLLLSFRMPADRTLINGTGYVIIKNKTQKEF